MCLILFANQYSEKFKLILLSNRDEYHNREALKAHYWSDTASIFGGIDKQAKGSWLAVDKLGRLAAVTNIRKGLTDTPHKQSRGMLVNRFLQQSILASDFIEELKLHSDDYSPFNILLLDDTGLWHYSSEKKIATLVPTGIHGLSNATLDTPWPKVKRGITALKKCLVDTTLSRKNLLSSISSKEQANESDLPETGVSLKFEKLLSPQFIVGENYGTRCTTLITVDNNNLLTFEEITFNTKGHIESTVEQSIQLDT